MRHLAVLAVVVVVGGLVSGQLFNKYGKYDDGRDRYSDEVEWREENRQARRHCQSCNPDECPTATDCVAGIVKDPCHCCDVCGKAEFELCDHPQVNAALVVLDTGTGSRIPKYLSTGAYSKVGYSLASNFSSSAARKGINA